MNFPYLIFKVRHSFLIIVLHNKIHAVGLFTLAQELENVKNCVVNLGNIIV